MKRYLNAKTVNLVEIKLTAYFNFVIESSFFRFFIIRGMKQEQKT